LTTQRGHYKPEEKRATATLHFRVMQKERERLEAIQKELGHVTLSKTIRYLINRAIR
jgi:antitoxin component of RelBE/YafQ-DinJ toxin-antitoxin module